MMSGPQQQPLIIFMHLPKTAGSTLARIIERQYEGTTILPLYESSFGEELAAIPPSQRDVLRIIMGHLYFGAHTFLSRRFAYVTMLRDPVDRVISHYNFVRHYPSHYLYDSACKMSLREYVEFCNRQEPNNDQTRLVAGKCDGASFGTCSDEMLETAMRNLAGHFAVIGLTEEFDRSLILMKRILGWRNPFYVSQNVGRHRTRKEEIPPETLGVIQAYNALDVELYRYAKGLFWEQVRVQGNSFEQEMRTFRKLNASYGRLHLFISSGIDDLKSRYRRSRHQQTS